MSRLISRKYKALRMVLAMLCGLGGCGIAFPVRAQVIQATGGTSNLFNATGGSLELRGPNFTDQFDLGYAGKIRTGFSIIRGFQGGIAHIGDQTVSFILPTDIFDQSHYFLGRGAGFSRNLADGKLFVFAGATANGFFTPFLNVAALDTATFALFYERKLTPHWRLYSRNAFSKTQTAIQSLEWTPKENMHAAVSGGVGNNQPYGAFSFTLVERLLSADMSYALVGDNFRRVLVQTPQVSEPDRENIRFDYHPWRSLRFIASRNNFASGEPTGATERAAVNSLGTWTNLAGFQFYGSANQSVTPTGSAMSYLLGGNKNIFSRLTAGIDYTLSTYRNQSSPSAVIGNIREVISPRISITELITHTGGQTSVSYGGTFISNRVTVSAEYETLFFPFATPGTPQFRQVMVLGLHFQLPFGIQLNYGTDVSSGGQVHYSAYGTSIGYRTPKGGGGGGPRYAGSFYSNVARGRVVDPSGDPVSGAAILIGKNLVFSDSAGTFLVRLKSTGELPLVVSLDDFTAPGSFAVVSAPHSVFVTREDDAQIYNVVVKRVDPLSTKQSKPDSF
jgi:hypothetical protein